MLPQISRMALELVQKEVGNKNFTAYTLNRLQVKDPYFVTFAKYLASAAKSRVGDVGYNLALAHCAFIYRVFELSDRFPDMPSGDPMDNATKDALAQSAQETAEIIKRLQNTDGKWPHETP